MDPTPSSQEYVLVRGEDALRSNEQLLQNPLHNEEHITVVVALGAQRSNLMGLFCV